MDRYKNIFLNTKGVLDDVDEELRSLLDYFESQVPQDAFTGKLDEAVAAAKLHKEWRQESLKVNFQILIVMRAKARKGVYI